jgi:nucleoside-diphosphate-sugar epimerase
VGGTGFIGRHLVQRWPADQRSQLRILIHRSRPGWAESGGIDVRAVDLANPASVVAALSGSSVAINLMRPQGDGRMQAATGMLVSSLAQTSIRRYIHCSSIDVYGRTKASHIGEETVPDPRSPYEREHLAAEALASAADCDVCIVRLGAVFGPGGRNVALFVNEAQGASLGKLVLRRALYGKRRLHLVSVETVVDALRFLAQREGQVGFKHLLLTDDDAPENNFGFLQDALAQAFGRPPLAWVPTLPAACLRLMLTLRGAANIDPTRRFAGEERLRSLGFAPDVDFRSRLGQYIDDARAAKPQGSA